MIRTDLAIALENAHRIRDASRLDLHFGADVNSVQTRVQNVRQIPLHDLRSDSDHPADHHAHLFVLLQLDHPDLLHRPDLRLRCEHIAAVQLQTDRLEQWLQFLHHTRLPSQFACWVSAPKFPSKTRCQ